MSSRFPSIPFPTIPGTWGWRSSCRNWPRGQGDSWCGKIYHSGQLYKDAHVTKALRTGTVEMCVPGNWLLEAFDTSTSLTMLPMFFGQPGKITEDLIDGEVGEGGEPVPGKEGGGQIPRAVV